MKKVIFSPRSARKREDARNDDVEVGRVGFPRPGRRASSCTTTGCRDRATGSRRACRSCSSGQLLRPCIAGAKDANARLGTHAAEARWSSIRRCDGRRGCDLRHSSVLDIVARVRMLRQASIRGEVLAGLVASAPAVPRTGRRDRRCAPDVPAPDGKPARSASPPNPCRPWRSGRSPDRCRSPSARRSWPRRGPSVG